MKSAHFGVCQDNHHIHKTHGCIALSWCATLWWYINLAVTTSSPAWLLLHSIKPSNEVLFGAESHFTQFSHISLPKGYHLPLLPSQHSQYILVTCMFATLSWAGKMQREKTQALAEWGWKPSELGPKHRFVPFLYFLSAVPPCCLPLETTGFLTLPLPPHHPPFPQVSSPAVPHCGGLNLFVGSS